MFDSSPQMCDKNFFNNTSYTFSQLVNRVGSSLKWSDFQQNLKIIDKIDFENPDGISSKLTIEILEQGAVLVSLLLTLNIFHTLF